MPECRQLPRVALGLLGLACAVALYVLHRPHRRQVGQGAGGPAPGARQLRAEPRPAPVPEAPLRPGNLFRPNHNIESCGTTPGGYAAQANPLEGGLERRFGYTSLLVPGRRTHPLDQYGYGHDCVLLLLSPTSSPSLRFGVRKKCDVGCPLYCRVRRSRVASRKEKFTDHRPECHGRRPGKHPLMVRSPGRWSRPDARLRLDTAHRRHRLPAARELCARRARFPCRTSGRSLRPLDHPERLAGSTAVRRLSKHSARCALLRSPPGQHGGAPRSARADR